MTSTARMMCALAMLAAPACEDPTLFAGDGPEALSEVDAAVDASAQASRDAGDAARPDSNGHNDPRELWRNLPKECRSCSSVRSLDDCRFSVPPTLEDIERFGCYECACCEDTSMCRQFGPNATCIALSRERDSIGTCRSPFGGGGGGPP